MNLNEWKEFVREESGLGEASSIDLASGGAKDMRTNLRRAERNVAALQAKMKDLLRLFARPALSDARAIDAAISEFANSARMTKRNADEMRKAFDSLNS